MSHLLKIPSRKKVLSVLFFMAVASAVSQNLVLNSSFENVNAGLLQCGAYQSQASFNAAINNWKCPTAGTSDIYSTTLNTSCSSSPFSTFSAAPGVQAPRTGNAMVGCCFFGPTPSSLLSYREYIEGELSTPLNVGRAYKIKFYVSMADNYLISCNNIGLKFTTAPLNSNTLGELNIIPDVNYTGPPITDSVNWAELEFCYTPTTSGLKYFIIGNFFNDSVTAATNGSFSLPYAYYYIDDVWVESTSDSITVSPASTSLCAGSATPLTASGASAYTWLPSAGLNTTTGATVTASPTITTTYTVLGSSLTAPCQMQKEVLVMVNQVSLSITPSATTICTGESVTLAAAGASSYTWSTGSYASSITVSPPGNTVYTLSASNGSCTASTSVEVIIQAISAAVNTVNPVCLGKDVTLTASGGERYSWKPVVGSTNPGNAIMVVQPMATAVYSVTITGVGACTTTKTVEVMVYPVPHVYAGRDTTIDSEGFATLTGRGNTEVGFFALSLLPLNCSFCSSIMVSPSETSCYLLKGINEYGCTALDTVCVQVVKNDAMYIPNSFTPDGDGINDVFVPVGFGLESMHLTVFNRWGAEVFSSDDNNPGWDGIYKGATCEQGVYAYQAEAKKTSGKTIIRTGHLTLLCKATDP